MVALNSEAIMDCEERLGLLLKKLIKFHGYLSYDKSSITLEQIWSLEEKLKSSIEQLICLGIQTNKDKNNSIIAIVD